VIRPFSVGDRIRPGEYRIHSRFPAVINLLSGDDLISLVTERVGAGPINIVLPGSELAGAAALSARPEGLKLDGRALCGEPVYDSGLPRRLGPDRAHWQRGIADLQALVAGSAHPKSLAFLIAPRRRSLFRCGFERSMAERLHTGAQAVMRGDLESGARTLRGTGFGLTPSGDDFLAGYMWGLHARRALGDEDPSAAIARLCAPGPGANPLARAFLRCAQEGRFFSRLKALIEAMLDGTPAQAAGRARDLLDSGETSGADVAVGFLISLQKEAVPCS
jgi:hypothetical protein